MFLLVAFAVIALSACGGSSEKSDTASTVALRAKNAALSCADGGACVAGDIGPGGGKVFYVAPTRFTSTGSACGSACKYLEAAPVGWITAATPVGQTNCLGPGTSTADPQCPWSGAGYTSISTAQQIGDGYANTSAIIAQSNLAGTAATVARAFRGGGKTDWYLPSINELIKMYPQKSTIGGISAFYWSSSEVIATGAFFQLFDNGLLYYATKLATLSVRPVRAF
jgi:hypothetical protein